jgi:hypothetical protein
LHSDESVLFDDSDTLHLLPDEVRIEDVAKRTRHAALTFLNGAALGWGRTKLRSWLIVEYGMATEWTRDDETATWKNPVTQLPDAKVQAIVEDARRRATRMVAEASRVWSEATFAADMIANGMIATLFERSGREAYAPVARAGMTFVEQVASLFIADYLAHAKDYEMIASCGSCGEIPLNGRIRHARGCFRPPAESGVCLKDAAAASMRITAWPPVRGMGMKMKTGSSGE